VTTKYRVQQWRSQDFSLGEELAGVWGRSLQPSGDGGLGQKLGNFCNFFNKNYAFLCIYGQISYFKGRVQCFSKKVVMNKCFLLNPEKNLAQIRFVLFEKNAPLIPKNDVTEATLIAN